LSKPSNTSQLTRREFVAGGAALVTGTALASCLPGVDGRWVPEAEQACAWTAPQVTPGFPAQAGRVVSIHNWNMVNPPPQVKINEEHVAPTLAALLKKLTGESELSRAWAALLPGYQAGQVVGIKVNTLNSKVPTHPEVIQALVQSLKDHAQVPGSDILVWDRRLDELLKAGFKESTIGCKVIGTVDDTASQGDGPGYEPEGICLGSERGRLTKLITKSGDQGGIDHLINVAVLKNHLASGFTGVLKNHYGTFHNPGTFHDKVDVSTGQLLEKRFEQAIPTINALPEVAKKSRLWLMDATIVVTKGDTDAAADWIPYLLLGSLDPVALDARGRAIRDESVVASGAPKPDETISEGWLVACERVGLGSATVATLEHEDITNTYEL
jgi:uncharacterized protein (DUF362 family)